VRMTDISYRSVCSHSTRSPLAVCCLYAIDPDLGIAALMGSDASTTMTLTIIAQEKLVINPIDRHQLKIILLPYKLERFVRWI
jgi:hypothetical protein